MRKLSQKRSFLPRLSLLEDRTVPATHTWTGGGTTGDWSQVANWDSQGVPGSSNDEPLNDNVLVIFPDFPSVTQRNSNQNIAGLILDRIEFQGNNYALAIGKTTAFRQGFDQGNSNGTISNQLLCTGTGTASITGGTLVTTNGDGFGISIDSGNTLNISAVLASSAGGDDGFTTSGAGILSLSGANTFTSSFTVGVKAAIAASPTALGTSAAGTTILEGCFLDVRTNIGTEPLTFTSDNDPPFTPGTLASVASGTVGGPITLAFGGNTPEDLRISDGLTINGPISGNGGIVKFSTGTTTLTGTNTYNGTTVEAGTLVVNGDNSAAGKTIVQSGATFAGKGKVAALSIDPGATLAPGQKTATTPFNLTVGGDLEVFGTFAPVISGTTGGAADQVVVQGAVAVTGLTFTPFRNGAGVAVGKAFVLIDNDGTDAIVGTFETFPEGATVPLGGQNFTISYIGGTGNDVTFTATTAVPGTPPTITDVANQTGKISSTISAIAFTVGDAQTAAGSLTVTAKSSNTAIVANAGITLGGSGASRTVALATLATAGTTTITLTVTDGDGETASDSFTVTTSATGSKSLPKEFSVGSELGAGTVSLRNADNSIRFTLTPFGAGFAGGIRTVAADFNGDGVADLAVASGPGMPGTVRIFDGLSQAQLALPESVGGGGTPFGSSFVKSIHISAGDMNDDGRADLIMTADAGGGARVRVFSSTAGGFVQRSDFFALINGFGVADDKFRGGSRATVSDINGDGTGDLIWAAGIGGGPRIATFNGKLINNGNQFNGFKLTGDFFAVSDSSIRDGAYIACGDFDGDGSMDLAAGGGSGAPPEVRIFSGAGLIANSSNPTPFVSFFFGNASTRKGVRVAVKDLDGDNRADLVVGSAPTTGTKVSAFAGKNLAGSNTGNALFSFDAFSGTGGVFVG